MKFDGEPAAACLAPTDDDGMTPLRYAAGVAGSVGRPHPGRRAVRGRGCAAAQTDCHVQRALSI